MSPTQTTLPGSGVEPVTTCRRCGRVLTNPTTQAAGIGKVCARKEALAASRQQFTAEILTGMDLSDMGGERTGE